MQRRTSFAVRWGIGRERLDDGQHIVFGMRYGVEHNTRVHSLLLVSILRFGTCAGYMRAARPVSTTRERLAKKEVLVTTMSMQKRGGDDNTANDGGGVGWLGCATRVHSCWFSTFLLLPTLPTYLRRQL